MWFGWFSVWRMNFSLCMMMISVTSGIFRSRCRAVFWIYRRRLVITFSARFYTTCSFRICVLATNPQVTAPCIGWMCDLLYMINMLSTKSLYKILEAAFLLFSIWCFQVSLVLKVMPKFFKVAPHWIGVLFRIKFWGGWCLRLLIHISLGFPVLIRIFHCWHHLWVSLKWVVMFVWTLSRSRCWEVIALPFAYMSRSGCRG